jgi:NitT/TauT family transport system ATP-binding protein
VIRLSGAGVRFGHGESQVNALGPVDLTIGPTAFLSVVGPSGSGKTTLLRLIAGSLPPSSGSVKRDESASSRSRIRMISQEKSVFPWMNALDNATFGLRMMGLSEQERRRRALPLFERMGLAGREKSWPSELSTGMKQRIAIMRAFLSDPSLLLMDEPFAALDAFTRAALQQDVLELWSSQRVPVVFVTHDIEEAILLAERVLVLDGPPGRIALQFDVPFGYPRSFEMTTEPDFVELKRMIHARFGLRREAVHAR